MREVAPPGVMAFSLGKKAERVDESGRYRLVDALPFFFCETMFPFVLFGVGEIVRRVCHIEVATENNRFAFL